MKLFYYAHKFIEKYRLNKCYNFSLLFINAGKRIGIFFSSYEDFKLWIIDLFL